jgi:putative transposase
VQEWIGAVGAKSAYITLGSPWENEFIERFDARLRDELLDGAIFCTLREAEIVIESWRRHLPQSITALQFRVFVPSPGRMASYATAPAMLKLVPRPAIN